MIFILLFLTVSLVVAVRFVLRRVRDSIVATRPTPEGAQAGEGRDGGLEGGPEDDDERPVTGRELKERYLRGEMSKAEYDQRLRALQLDEYLKGRQ